MRNGSCELQQLCAELGVDVEDKLDGEKTGYKSAGHLLLIWYAIMPNAYYVVVVLQLVSNSM